MVTTAVAVLHWNMSYSLVVRTTAIVVCPVTQTQQGVNHERHTGLVITSQSGSETELFRQQAQTFICYATTQHHLCRAAITRRYSLLLLRSYC